MMKSRMLHCNINVTDVERSVAFYQQALGLSVGRKKEAEDGSYRITFLQDDSGEGLLELTWLKAHPQPYNLGENESHIAFSVPDYEAAHQLHDEMGCICYENKEMGLYFISDPDGYWLEILPEGKGR